ncbi:MAG: helix-turn-helix domain-containing protein [Gammaproteobacteria bacterium]|nr:helix-turn-helix domain-containing protein [Gammaproteobacteria bacterium]
MIDNESNDEASTDEVPREKLGVTLQRAREFKGLRTEDVAHRLNLSTQRIYDMENDDYRFAGAETYAKGYLRSYAKLLGLDPDLLVREFDRLKYTDTIERHETKLLVRRQFSSGDRWIRWVTYSIGMILIFLVAIWWRGQPNHSIAPTVATDSTDQTSTDITAQATQKTEATNNQSTEAQSESTSLLPKSEAQPNSLESSLSQPGTQTKDSDSKKTTTQTPDPAATQKEANTVTSSTTADPKLSSNQNTTKPTAVTPAAADEESDDSEESDEDTDTNADSSTITKKHSWYQIKPFKPKVLVGQRDREERALLQELEKVFGRG